MEIDHGNRTAVVTGAARGIGERIAIRLAESSADLLLIDVNENVENVAESISSGFGVSTKASVTDVSDYEAVQSAVSSAATNLGPPDILVNNAAITTNVATVESIDPSEWKREIEVNLTGPFNCAKTCLEYMDGFGRIVNISSNAGDLGGYGQCAYASSKSGLLGLTKTIALERAKDGVTCNAILPGRIKSPAAATVKDEIRDRILHTIPTNESGEPVDIANAVNFLSSEQARYINGAELHVDAGQRLFTF
jgi:NAD(P)-dependent dehydrogenase (short-subunit alcohol dehydrogenase family)